METVTQHRSILTNTVEQTASRTGLSERSIWKAIAEGRLSVVRVAGRVLIPEESLRVFLGLQERQNVE